MNDNDLVRRLAADLQDSYDEELEMEIEDRHPCPMAPEVPRNVVESVVATSASCSNYKPNSRSCRTGSWKLNEK